MEATIVTRNEQEQGDMARRRDAGVGLSEALGGQRRRMAFAESVGAVMTEAEAARQAEMRRPVPAEASDQGMGI